MAKKHSTPAYRNPSAVVSPNSARVHLRHSSPAASRCASHRKFFSLPGTFCLFEAPYNMWARLLTSESVIRRKCRHKFSERSRQASPPYLQPRFRRSGPYSTAALLPLAIGLADQLVPTAAITLGPFIFRMKLQTVRTKGDTAMQSKHTNPMNYEISAAVFPPR
jgi:hypothetical protein